MSVLSIRNFPDALLMVLKVRAAQFGMTLQQYVTTALDEKVREDRKKVRPEAKQ